jgi:hypothetical protein
VRKRSRSNLQVTDKTRKREEEEMLEKVQEKAEAGRSSLLPNR